MKRKLMIKQLREDREISQQELADLIKLNRATLSQIETGKVLPTIDVLLKISRALGCEYTDLYKEEDLKIINPKIEQQL